jgi:hypothetical protein
MHETAVVLAEAYEGVTTVIAELADADRTRPTRCAGWSVDALVAHLLLDAQRALIALASDVHRDPDRRLRQLLAVLESLRRAGGPHVARWLRNPARSGLSLAALAADAVGAHYAGGGARRRARNRMLRWRPRIMCSASPTCAARWWSRPSSTTSTSSSTCRRRHCRLAHRLQVARQTLDGLWGRPAPSGWDDVGYVLKATGREPLTAADRADLRTAADALPLLG